MSSFHLPITRYRFNLQADTLIQFPPYAGSTWRGAFGHALRRTVCVTREPSCAGCLLQRSCVYSYVFETPAGQEPMLGKIDTAPHPYILHPLDTSGSQYTSDEHLQVGLTLIGKAIDHLPYMIHALQQVGTKGIGKHDGQYTLLDVEQEISIGTSQWQTIYQNGHSLQALPSQLPACPTLPDDGYVTITFHSPYRAIQDGKLVRSGRFTFQAFIMQIIRRVSLLHALHTEQIIHPDVKQLAAQAANVPLHNPQLYWYEWSRYSNRQQTKVQMGGLIGSFQIPAALLADYWEWLWLGQWTHVGKGAVMGMGEYSLHLTSSPA